MLPLSLGRTSPDGSHAGRLHGALTWQRPANITSVSNLQRRALNVWLALAVAVGVAIALGHVWLRLKVAEYGYHLSATRQVVEKLQQEGHELTVEVAALDSPARLEEAARTRFGMTRPEKGQEAVLP